MLPSSQQYQYVLANCLSVRQIEILQTLFYFPNSSATAKELAISLNYESYRAANRQIGQIGKKISQNKDITPPKYQTKDGYQPAYFLLIGEYYKDIGWKMRKELQEALITLNLVSINRENSVERLATEASSYNEKLLFKEGKVVQIFVNRYERNQQARQECIRFYGYRCYTCKFDFGETYGNIASGYIHVHHLRPLGEITEEYIIDPIKDLVPVCPNCHAVLHLTKPAMTIEKLKQRLKKRSK